MTIEELCKRSYDTAVAKGWHEEPRSLGEVIALFHSEVSEALECWRDPAHKLDEIWMSEGGKPEGFVIELADLLIRIGDASADMPISVVRALNNTSVSMLGYGLDEDMNQIDKSIPELLTIVHCNLSRAFEDWVCDELDEEGKDDAVALSLAMAMNVVGAICRRNKLDLEKALVLKMGHNDLRDYRHGGKRA